MQSFAEGKTLSSETLYLIRVATSMPDDENFYFFPSHPVLKQPLFSAGFSISTKPFDLFQCRYDYRVGLPRKMRTMEKWWGVFATGQLADQ